MIYQIISTFFKGGIVVSFSQRWGPNYAKFIRTYMHIRQSSVLQRMFQISDKLSGVENQGRISDTFTFYHV